MMKTLIALTLLAVPTLGTPVTVERPSGLWDCSAMCLTSGNDDGGYCRMPVIAKNQPTEAACVENIKSQCATKKPPPGGCRLSPGASSPDSY